MVWKQTFIDGKLADVFEPRGRREPGCAVIFLHGHGQITLKDDAVYTAELERHGLFCVCPAGKRSWWADRICREFDPAVTPLRYVRDSVLGWLAEQWHIAPPRVALLGVSMGGQGALGLAYRFPQQFPTVAAISPLIDFHTWYGQGLPLDEMYESSEEARHETATLLIHPLNWPRHQLLLCDAADAQSLEGTERLASKLASTGIPFESDFTIRHGGHSWEYFGHVAARAMQFARESLDDEIRRAGAEGADR